MANYQSTHTGAEIDAGIDLLNNNSATGGQVLMADGVGKASWQNAQGGALWYIHRVVMSNTADTTEILFFTDNNLFPINNLDELYRSISGIEAVRYYKIQGDVSTLCNAFYVRSFPTNTSNTTNFNLFAFNSQGEIISIPVAFISDTVTPLQ